MVAEAKRTEEPKEENAMLEINMDDVIAVVQSIAPQLIVIAVALALGVII